VDDADNWVVVVRFGRWKQCRRQSINRLRCGPDHVILGKCAETLHSNKASELGDAIMRNIAKPENRQPLCLVEAINFDLRCMQLLEKRVFECGIDRRIKMAEAAQQASLRYRSFKNFRTVILFRCGGLNLHPTTQLPG